MACRILIATAGNMGLALDGLDGQYQSGRQGLDNEWYYASYVYQPL